VVVVETVLLAAEKKALEVFQPTESAMMTSVVAAGRVKTIVLFLHSKVFEVFVAVVEMEVI
jgi:hypothetical protein